MTGEETSSSFGAINRPRSSSGPPGPPASPCERCDFSESWTARRQLGHRDRLQAWLRAGRPSLAAPQRPLLRLGNWDMGYGTPG